MKIEYRKGDLFQTSIKVIVHGCNDVGVMGSGVAKIIVDRYPEAYEVYRKYHRDNGKLEGGKLIVCATNGKIIVNMITQNYFGKDGRKYAKYDWIADGFHELDLRCSQDKIEQIAMPMIGAGLGGGNWNVISAIIESECKNVQPVVYQL